MDRKQFLKNSTKGVACTMLFPTMVFCTTNGQQNEVQGNYSVNENFNPETDIELTAIPSELQLFSGHKTSVYTYKSKLLKGEQHSLKALEGSFLGPVIRRAVQF